MTTLDDVLADLAALSAGLDAVVAPLDDDAWRTPTPAPGWTIAHQIAHLAWTDAAAGAAATDPDGWAALVADAAADPHAFVDRAADAGAAAGPAALVGHWRATRAALARALRDVPAGDRVPWFGPPMSPMSMATARFMETWAHGLDVREGLGVGYTPDDAIRHVAHLGVRTRDFGYVVHGEQPPAEPFGVRLSAPSGAEWTWGPDDAVQTVTGPAYDFCLLVTQRRHRTGLALTASGPDADHWLDIAQAFAGPPGAGRSAEGGADA